MHFVDKVFPRWEKKIFFTALGAIVLTVAILLAPALIKLIFSKFRFTAGSFRTGWAYFIFAHLLFLVQVFFFFLHPSCRTLTIWGRGAIGFLLLYLLGGLLSPFLTETYSSRALQEILKILTASSLLFVFIYFSHKWSSNAILRAVAFFGCVLITAEAVIGLSQYYLQRDVGLQCFGEKHLEAVVGYFATIRVPESGRWLFDCGHGSSEVLRAYGTFDHPNHFGGVLIAGFFLTCHLLHQARPIRVALVTLALTIQAMALVSTFSRSAWLGIAVGVFLFLCLRLAHYHGGLLLKCRQLWAADRSVLMGLAVSAVVTFCVFHEQILHRCALLEKFKKVETSYRSSPLQTLKPLEYIETLDLGEREQFSKVAKRMIVAHPWKGIGFQQFVQQIPQFVNLPHASGGSIHINQPLPVHNIYMLTAAEIGLPGAVALIIFFVLVVGQGIRRAGHEVLFAIWLGFVLIGFVDNYFLTSQAGRILLFVVAGLLT